MSGMEMNKSSHDWLGRFCVHLMGVWPDIGLRAAVNRAVVTYEFASDMQPEVAANIEAMRRLRLLTSPPGTPEEAIGNRTHGHAKQAAARRLVWPSNGV